MEDNTLGSTDYNRIALFDVEFSNERSVDFSTLTVILNLSHAAFCELQAVGMTDGP